MAILPMPSSLKLHPNIPVFNGRMVVVERKLTHVVAASTIAINPSTNTQLNNNPYNTGFDEWSLRPMGSVTDRVLFKDRDSSDLKFTFSKSKSATTDEGLGKEVGIIMQRLERVAERMRELELEKLKSRIRGEISCEETILVENMSREIVSSFLAKPIQYLKSSGGKLEDKLKDLKFLVDLLEQSSLDFYNCYIYKRVYATPLEMQIRCWKMSAHQRPRLSPSNEVSEPGDSGILNERILMLVFESINWDIHVLCKAASVSRKLHAVAKRLLWREMCVYRAPRMVATLANGAPNRRIGGGWHALAKLLFFCCGCEPTRHFQVSQPCRGHFVKATRFSKTSGRSFLTKKCRDDLLYVSDPCEHPMGNKEDDLGIYRGVFRGFMKSRTRHCLIGRRVEFDERVRCPYCGARVWSMTTARLVPKSAARRLGSHDGGLEYFVCVNGHLHGTCWLVPLSSDEDVSDHDEDDDSGVDGHASGSEDGDHSGYGGVHSAGCEDQMVTDGNVSSKKGKGVGGGPAP
ncbi:hypothetical protein F0562_002581 [Nyssa sinensis]|uniref:Tetrapyrrole biosynthesis glutamyl-tRNA reductase dimerisation domain-containing protein n=1 Tax=Nyssa sinensis TaxID=561372 RepID=A0A5J5C9Y2_9ASTE|nr:hypothetical protein F0562_002581 [Nyssa sinensis]